MNIFIAAKATDGSWAVVQIKPDHSRWVMRSGLSKAEAEMWAYTYDVLDGTWST